MAKVGDKVIFYYWIGGHEGALFSAPATITAMHPPEQGVAGPPSAALEVAFPLGVAEREGFATAQSHSRQRTITDDTIHASGTWAIAS